eukprot:5675688-Pleurochrysis_carterae.AAC.1
MGIHTHTQPPPGAARAACSGSRRALPIVRLQKCEGELPFGLAVRTFNPAVEDVISGKVEVRWYKRKSKNLHSWGTQPAF